MSSACAVVRRCLAPATVVLFLAGAGGAWADTAADLDATSPQPPDERTVGSVVTYAYMVSNNGPTSPGANASDPTDMTVTDHLGASEELVSITADRGTCPPSAPATCSLGPVEPGGYAVVTVKVKLVRTGQNQHTYAVSGAANADPNPANDAGAISYEVAPAGSVPGATPKAVTGEWFRRQASADLEATLTPYGEGSYHFEYGKTKSYGKKTAATDVRGNRAVKRTDTIDGLEMNTTYHYRVVLVVAGKTYRGRDRTVRTLGKLRYGPLTLEPTKRGASTTTYTGLLGDHVADAPGACAGTVTVAIYLTSGASITERKTQLRKDCTYRIRMPIGSQSARRYGPKGTVLVQAHFEGNRAVSRVGSEADRP
jgi:hypothetical protein